MANPKSSTYDTSQPRYCLTRPDGTSPHFELGQNEALGEAKFWLMVGYTVNVSEYNGKIYVRTGSHKL